MLNFSFSFGYFINFLAAGICLNEVVFGKEFVERKRELNKSDQRKSLSKNKKVIDIFIIISFIITNIISKNGV